MVLSGSPRGENGLFSDLLSGHEVKACNLDLEAVHEWAVGHSLAYHPPGERHDNGMLVFLPEDVPAGEDGEALFTMSALSSADPVDFGSGFSTVFSPEKMREGVQMAIALGFEVAVLPTWGKEDDSIDPDLQEDRYKSCVWYRVFVRKLDAPDEGSHDDVRSAGEELQIGDRTRDVLGG
jgi:hypothetical protein